MPSGSASVGRTPDSTLLPVWTTLSTPRRLGTAVTAFDPEKFDDKYAHYFEELEAAYSEAYQQLHGQYDSAVLQAVDRRILNESEPVYEGDGEFSVRLPEDVETRIEAVSADAARVETVLDAYTDRIEAELRALFEFPE